MPIDYEQRRRQRAEVQGMQRESARRAESAKSSPLKSSGSAARAQAPAPSMKKAAPDPTFDAPSAPLTASDLPAGTPRTKKREFGPGDV